MSRTTLVHAIAVALLTSGTLGAEAPTTITVTVPDYEVTRVGEFDEVTIPGGGQLVLEEGRPQVPYYNEVVEYPAGYRIQDVTLTDRSGEKTDSGLILATVDLSTYGAEWAKPEPPKKGVYPATDYGWEAIYGHDGSATLVISVFPFAYDPVTTKSTFHKEYTFEVEHIKTGVSIAGAEPTRTSFEPGDKARVTLALANTGKPEEVVVNATVRKAFTLERVADIPAKTVSGLGASDTVTLEWPTRKQPTGDYAVDIEVRDNAGNRLARERTTFRLGTPLGEVTELTARPQFFKLGDDINLGLKFKNTGSSRLTGTCVFRVMKDGDVIDEMRQELPALKPGGSKAFTETWGTDEAEENAEYYAIGYVEYEGMASEPKNIMFSTNRPPTASFAATPETTFAGAEVRFDGTASSDEDGTISAFDWEFDDGATSADSVTTHTFWLPGTYSVRLTVTDDDGGTGSAEKPVIVSEPPEDGEQEEQEEPEN